VVVKYNAVALGQAVDDPVEVARRRGKSVQEEDRGSFTSSEVDREQPVLSDLDILPPAQPVVG
jgi:hypothetical protein